MMDDASEYGASAYWKEELAGFDYMFDASPLLIAKLREHTYHLTGLRSYEYREHHTDQASRFASKLRRLQEVDSSNLFVPEAPQLGGFGHRIGGRLVNLDTLRFYECLIALDRAGVISQLRGQGRHRILEIGAGMGWIRLSVEDALPQHDIHHRGPSTNAPVLSDLPEGGVSRRAHEVLRRTTGTGAVRRPRPD
jgi:hypothetical protein